ncbi:GNAT family N-acetyltransferase [Nonomuraea turcica]|uniref:GNAT family N-acetyltransferase n=1 Tax=Nonomuraea sp. G32 TaxID=3067274 RepID=UPI00273ADF68|nr:GNAT family N-acetyltransferase [Nonomuraea sp. G32]MDP4503194.1 GNAT family N-acetyltransferase [Nonomuraea sp. G32]
MPTPANLSFHRASPAHTAEVLSVLNEAADWLRRREVTQWPDRFEPSWIDEAITRGETWLVRAGDKAVGTLTLDWSDPLWSDVAGSAGYVHRMAVRRRAAGLGAVILDWAADTVRLNRREVLRLDCVASNSGLRAYYEARGFVHRGDVPVGGAPGQRRDDGPRTWVSRYELPLPG